VCLDNDEAGLNAVERICTDSEMWNFLENNGIELLVASLPSGIKDPAEFIESKGGVQIRTNDNLFRSSVMKTAATWNDWFITRLISKYDPTDTSSFSSVCDNLSTFLSNHPNAAERTKRAYEAAGKLAELISKRKGDASNGPLRIQLESDLLGMASRKAAARQALARRIEASVGEIGSKSKILKMSSGEPTTQDDAPYIPNVAASRQRFEKGNYTSPQLRIRNSMPKNSNIRSSQVKKYTRHENDPPITAHFHGFQFCKTDAEWLGITTEKVSSMQILLPCNFLVESYRF
jgi:DNA primase